MRSQGGYMLIMMFVELLLTVIEGVFSLICFIISSVFRVIWFFLGSTMLGSIWLSLWISRRDRHVLATAGGVALLSLVALCAYLFP